MFKKMSLLVLGITLFACGAGAKWPEADRQKILSTCGSAGQPAKTYCECGLAKLEASFTDFAAYEKATTEAKKKITDEINATCSKTSASPAPAASK